MQWAISFHINFTGYKRAQEYKRATVWCYVFTCTWHTLSRPSQSCLVVERPGRTGEFVGDLGTIRTIVTFWTYVLGVIGDWSVVIIAVESLDTFLAHPLSWFVLVCTGRTQIVYAWPSRTFISDGTLVGARVPDCLTAGTVVSCVTHAIHCDQTRAVAIIPRGTLETPGSILSTQTRLERARSARLLGWRPLDTVMTHGAPVAWNRKSVGFMSPFVFRTFNKKHMER